MKKILVFLLFVFLPMAAVGLLLHLLGFSSNPEGQNPAAILTASLLSAGAMLIPFFAVVFTRLLFREPVFKDLGLSFRFNRWWWIGWVLMPVIALAVLGVTLLMPGAQWNPGGEMLQQAMSQLPDGFGMAGLIALCIFSGLIAGATLNAVFGLGEEIAWRGFLMKEFRGRSFLSAALLIGVIWGFWHAPLILNGHNYAQHPVAGVFMMAVMCLLMTPILMYFRQKSSSVIVPAVMHGTFNGVIGLTPVLVSPSNDLLYGGPGVAGFIVLLAVNIALFLIDRYWLKENIYTSALS